MLGQDCLLGDLCACLAQEAGFTLERKKPFYTGTCLNPRMHSYLWAVRAEGLCFWPSFPHHTHLMITLEASLSW